MKRLVAAVTVLAATAAVMSQGTFSSYATTKSNAASVKTQSSFLPSNLSVPSISGTVALSSTLTLVKGTWGYTHTAGENIGTSGEQAVTTADQWQFCISATCTNLTGQTGTTLTINATVVAAIGGLGLSTPSLSFRISETGSNASGTASAVTSNSLS